MCRRKQLALQRRVVELDRYRPGNANHCRPADVLSNRRPADPNGLGDHPLARPTSILQAFRRRTSRTFRIDNLSAGIRPRIGWPPSPRFRTQSPRYPASLPIRHASGRLIEPLRFLGVDPAALISLVSPRRGLVRRQRILCPWRTPPRSWAAERVCPLVRRH
jgi:hypothetical protein